MDLFQKLNATQKIKYRKEIGNAEKLIPDASGLVKSL